MESSGRFSVEYQGHERFEVEGFAVGENLQRNAVYRAELLHALDQVGQLADLVLAFVRRALGRGGEDAETEDINEIVVVHASAIDPLFRAAEELRRRLDRVFSMPSAPAKSLAVPAGMMPSSRSRCFSFIRLTT